MKLIEAINLCTENGVKPTLPILQVMMKVAETERTRCIEICKDYGTTTLDFMPSKKGLKPEFAHVIELIKKLEELED